MSDQVPATVVLSLTVQDVAESLSLYAKGLGAVELYRMAAPDGSIAQSEFMVGNSNIYISGTSAEWKAELLQEGQLAPCLFCLESDDPDASHERAIAAGFTSIEEPKDQFWGVRTAIVQDSNGYRWNFRKQVEELTLEEVSDRAKALFADCDVK